MEAVAAAAKMLLQKIAVDLVLDKEKRNKFLIAVGSIVAGLLLFVLVPIVVFLSLGTVQPPSVDIRFDEAAYFAQLTPEQQDNIAAIEADGQAIAEAMAAIDLQEQTVKAQLIYITCFAENRLSDFTAYAEHFSQDDEQLIQSLNYDYDLNIDYDEFMRTYDFVMNSITENGE